MINYEISLRLSSSCTEATAGKKMFHLHNLIFKKKIEIDTYFERVIKSKSLTTFPINLSFQEVNRFFVLMFEHDHDEDVQTRSNLSGVKLKYCNIRINANESFDRFLKIWK